jgi:hypothetical protein
MNAITRTAPAGAVTATPAQIAMIAPWEKRFAAMGHQYFKPAEFPTTDLVLLREALIACMLPATQRELGEVIAIIGVSWPHAFQRIEETTMDIHVRLLAEI